MAKKKLWGGRFIKKTDPSVEEFTRSIQYDYKLAEDDVTGSIAHVIVLKKAGYLTAKEASRLIAALKSIRASIVGGAFKPDSSIEDVHTQIQNMVEKKVGKLALRLHTARSRNDQVVFAMKSYCRRELLRLEINIIGLQLAICEAVHNNKDLVIPAFTHMQHAQPVYLMDHLMAYDAMLKRDLDRFSFIKNHIKMTMGAGALAGTPIDAAKYKMKFNGIDIYPAHNSIDAVSDRDFVIEILSALAIMGMHLSRLAEDLIIWSTKEFSFADIDESFCTGSSLMPQKKNPDALELVRGYAGRLYGNLLSVLTVMKGLPLSYNRDMQLDKEPLFDSFEIISQELKVLTGLIETLKFNEEAIRRQLEDESLYATDLVYYLVNRKVPFKEAHDIVGRLVRYSAETGSAIRQMQETELKKFSHKFVKSQVARIFDPAFSVKSKRSVRR